MSLPGWVGNQMSPKWEDQLILGRAAILKYQGGLEEWASRNLTIQGGLESLKFSKNMQPQPELLLPLKRWFSIACFRQTSKPSVSCAVEA
ncbi:hypothetical protein QYF61_010789 [Mycteria americana]|uniref:Uncharacterized protein n=1 Tax=Mycteria americana TaxID=33587 RepID=A0AAN7RWY7_MYCAM|nr:hypothetical protein QYF61_010789 [Mycteria americana]